MRTALEAAILELLTRRGPGKTICPPEAARSLVAKGDIVIRLRLCRSSGRQ